jgi:hypothetical protein
MHTLDAHQASQGGHDHALGRRQLGPINLAAQDSKLGSQKQPLRLGVLEPKPNVSDVEHHAQPRTEEPVGDRAERSSSANELESHSQPRTNKCAPIGPITGVGPNVSRQGNRHRP